MPKNINITIDSQLHQCDILKNFKKTTLIEAEEDSFSYETIIYNNIIILTQECDLVGDYNNRRKLNSGDIEECKNIMISCIVAPMYIKNIFMKGEHLIEFGKKMEDISSSKTKTNLILLNEIPRYHYIKFPEDLNLNDLIIDFKHFFSVNIDELENHKKDNFVCRLEPLYRDDLLRRFANYLSRIALP